MTVNRSTTSSERLAVKLIDYARPHPYKAQPLGRRRSHATGPPWLRRQPVSPHILFTLTSATRTKPENRIHDLQAMPAQPPRHHPHPPNSPRSRHPRRAPRPEPNWVSVDTADRQQATPLDPPGLRAPIPIDADPPMASALPTSAGRGVTSPVVMTSSRSTCCRRARWKLWGIRSVPWKSGPRVSRSLALRPWMNARRN